MKRMLFALICLVALPLAPGAQPAAKAPVPVNVSVSEVTDNRTTGAFNSECKLELKFTGDAAADALSIRGVRVRKAVDELGRNLIPAEDADAMRFGFGSGGSDRGGGVLKTELKLRNPSRNAAVIKIIEGDVELFSPTPANGGILVIPDILRHPAEPVQNTTLKKFGIDVMYLTRESYEAKKKQMEQDNAGNAIGDAFSDLFKGMFGTMMSSSSKNNLMLAVKDPQKRVVDVEFQDAAGKPLKRRSSWSSGELISQEFADAPPADTRLLIHLATPEAIQSVPFKIENVPLP